MVARLLDSSPSQGVVRGSGSRARDVLLATLAVRFDPRAERVAIDSALDTGARLVLASMLTLPPYPLTHMLAREYATLPHEEDLDAVRAAAGRVAALGLRTELLRVSSPRPVVALIELACERDAGLLVFGPDPSRVSKRSYRRAARAIRRDAPCLVWIAGKE